MIFSAIAAGIGLIAEGIGAGAAALSAGAGATGVVGAIGTAAAVGGTIAQISGQRRMAAASKQAEALRKQQMMAEEAARRRNTLRQMFARQAAARAIAANQGSQGSSAEAGALSGIASQAGMDINASFQTQARSTGIFNANASFAEGQGLSNIGGAFEKFGSGMVQKAPVISDIFTSLGGGSLFGSRAKAKT